MTKYVVTVDGKSYEVELLSKTGSRVDFSHAGKRYSVEVSHTVADRTAPIRMAIQPVQTKPRPAMNATGDISSPMPGIIVQVPVKPGDEVELGQTVAIVEAMKMENNIPATKKGAIKKVHVSTGQEVEGGQILVSIG